MPDDIALVRDHCPHLTANRCSVCRELDDAKQTIASLSGLLRDLRTQLDDERAPRLGLTCQCCGSYVGNCVCFGGVTTGPDGVTRTHSCSPKDHGR